MAILEATVTPFVIHQIVREDLNSSTFTSAYFTDYLVGGYGAAFPRRGQSHLYLHRVLDATRALLSMCLNIDTLSFDPTILTWKGVRGARGSFTSRLEADIDVCIRQIS